MSATKITYTNKVTKQVSTEEDIYKVTAPDMNEIKAVVNNNSDELNQLEVDTTIQKSVVTTQETIAQNTDYEIPLYYKVGADVLEVYYMGERLIKGTHYIEVGNSGAISNTIQFYNWGQSVPADRTIEFVVRGVYANES